jgi:hypothetical protein
VTDTVDSQLSPGAVKVDIGRANIIAIGLAIVLFMGLIAAGVYAAIYNEARIERFIGGGFAVLFAIPFVLVLANLRRVLTPSQVVFDGQGIHHWQGTSTTLLAWSEVAAVGIGYEIPPSFPKPPASLADAAAGFVGDKIKESLKMDGRRRVALEIFPVSPERVDGYPAMARFKRSYLAPAEGLPTVRWRIPLPPVYGVVGGITRGMQAHQPQRWLGDFARPWGTSPR